MKYRLIFLLCFLFVFCLVGCTFSDNTELNNTQEIIYPESIEETILKMYNISQIPVFNKTVIEQNDNWCLNATAVNFQLDNTPKNMLIIGLTQYANKTTCHLQHSQNVDFLGLVQTDYYVVQNGDGYWKVQTILERQTVEYVSIEQKFEYN